MKTELNLLGKRFNMAPRRNRRWLVICLFGACGLLMAAAWMRNRTGVDASIIALSFGALAPIIVGGEYWGKYFLFGSRGLVDPFYGNEILKRAERKDRSKVSRLLDPVIDDVRDVRNDERSLQSRDYAHFVAFRNLSFLIAFAFVLDNANSMGLNSIFGIQLRYVHQIIFGILQICWVMSLTLPQCVQLWTEPDMEPEQEPIN
jgi:hypothetical protein